MVQGSKQSRPLDVELLILVPILTFLLLVNGIGLVSTWRAGEATALELLQMALTTCFYVLLVGLLLIRRPAVRTTKSWVANIAAYVGSFLPFVLILNDGSKISTPLLTTASIALMLIGLTFSIYALSWLGRSFGAVPAARRLVRNGPYGVVRHPLYAAEIITFIGVVMGQLSLFSVAVLLTTVAVQVYRALQEEKVLTQAFPEYEDYRRDTRRFIPGVV